MSMNMIVDTDNLITHVVTEVEGVTMAYPVSFARFMTSKFEVAGEELTIHVRTLIKSDGRYILFDANGVVLSSIKENNFDAIMEFTGGSLTAPEEKWEDKLAHPEMGDYSATNGELYGTEAELEAEALAEIRAEDKKRIEG